jgi:hypothetical protein
LNGTTHTLKKPLLVLQKDEGGNTGENVAAQWNTVAVVRRKYLFDQKPHHSLGVGK